MSGNRTETSFLLVPDQRTEHEAIRATDDEHIGPGGLVVLRNGETHRITSTGDGQIGESAWSGRDAANGGTIQLAGGGRLLGLATGQVERIHSLADARRAGPPEAVARPLLVGPFGAALNRDVRIDVPRPADANGLMRLANDTWRWVPTRVEADRLIASLSSLAPFVAVRDATAPRIAAIRHQERPIIAITDELSGVDAESVRVWTKRDADRRPVAGRFDPDRGWFHFKRTPGRRSSPLIVEATDRAGNRTTVEFDPRVDRAFR
jgi:hypothetical protein